MLLFGCDFSSSPSRRKPIVVATGSLHSDRVRLHEFHTFTSLPDWGRWLDGTPEWIGGFDLPFGLPRELIEQLGWPLQWQACVEHYGAMSRPNIRARFKAFCAARPIGGKFAHRETDGPAGSSSSMKWVNPPVAYMLHAGVPWLLAADATLPALRAGRPDRVALEAYPGLLARELIGRRSYKSDVTAGATSERHETRRLLVEAIGQGRTRLGLRLDTTDAARSLLVDDPSGDHLDAALCLVQAAWAFQRRATRWGLPPSVDPLEGWIVTA